MEKQGENSPTVQKILSRETFAEITNPCCDLDRDNSKTFFFHKMCKLMTMRRRTKFSCKESSSSENITVDVEDGIMLCE